MLKGTSLLIVLDDHVASDGKPSNYKNVLDVNDCIIYVGDLFVHALCFRQDTPDDEINQRLASEPAWQPLEGPK